MVTLIMFVFYKTFRIVMMFIIYLTKEEINIIERV
jgi:hypothetical protein